MAVPGVVAAAKRQQRTFLRRHFGQRHKRPFVLPRHEAAVYEVFTASDNDLDGARFDVLTPKRFRDVFEPNDGVPTDEITTAAADPSAAPAPTAPSTTGPAPTTGTPTSEPLSVGELRKRLAAVPSAHLEATTGATAENRELLTAAYGTILTCAGLLGAEVEPAAEASPARPQLSQRTSPLVYAFEVVAAQ